MNHNINDDIELKLLANIPIEIEECGKFYVPTLREIAEIGEEAYNQYLSTLLVQKKVLEGHLGEDISNLETAWLLCYYDDSFREKFYTSIRFFFKDDISMGQELNELFFYFGEIGSNRRINKVNFEFIQSLIMVTNNVQVEVSDDYNPANEKARKLLEEINRTKAEVAKRKAKMTSLASNISGIAWKSHGMNIFKVFDMSIYQYFDALLTISKIDNYLFTLQGIYAGTVDSKKVNLTNIHWTNKNNI